jgi:hypothetical protein
VDNLGENVWCLVDIEVGSANTGACGCKKSENKSAIHKKRDDVNKSAKLQSAREISCYQKVSRLHLRYCKSVKIHAYIFEFKE